MGFSNKSVRIVTRAYGFLDPRAGTRVGPNIQGMIRLGGAQEIPLTLLDSCWAIHKYMAVI